MMYCKSYTYKDFFFDKEKGFAQESCILYFFLSSHKNVIYGKPTAVQRFLIYDLIFLRI